MKCVCCEEEIGLEENRVCVRLSGMRIDLHFWHLFELLGNAGAAAIEVLVARQKRSESSAQQTLRVVRGAK